MRDVRDPEGLTGGPDVAGQADPGQKGTLTAGRLELRNIDLGAVPELHAANVADHRVDVPDGSDQGVEMFADRLQDARGRLGQRGGPGQDVRHGMLGRRASFGTLPRRDVPKHGHAATQPAVVRVQGSRISR